METLVERPYFVSKPVENIVTVPVEKIEEVTVERIVDKPVYTKNYIKRPVPVHIEVDTFAEEVQEHTVVE